MSEPSICAEIGRCAYDAVNGDRDSGCPWWADCFGATPQPATSSGDTGTAAECPGCTGDPAEHATGTTSSPLLAEHQRWAEMMRRG